MGLNYAFSWLENAFGKMQLLEFDECTDLPQGFASAAAAINYDENGKELVGAKFKVILPLAAQVVNGVNSFFLCEETFMTSPRARRLVTLAVNEHDGEYRVVKESIKELF